jgi:enterochelin esterase-like enzyme
VAPPIPQYLSIHSRVLNEDREVWVRAPPGYQASKDAYPVLYRTEAPQHVNEIGSIIDFLVTSNRMPPVIVVGIGNTDRNRDLTPERADVKNGDAPQRFSPTAAALTNFWISSRRS